jgi:hypothetical protein
MYQKRIILGCFLLVFVALLFAGCGGRGATGEPVVPKYLKNNIHTQIQRNEYRASYANWTDPGERHVIIPVNTPVIVSTSRTGLEMITQETPSKTIVLEFEERNMGMDVDQYIALITSPQPISLNNLSAIDRKGIHDGKAYHGMTKEGVRIALGYPAVHRTPSLESNTWTYWGNRWRNYTVEFDKHGKVKSGK